MHARSKPRRTSRANRCTPRARSVLLREEPEEYFASKHALIHDALEILAVAGFAEGAGEGGELLTIDEALAERDLLRAADFQALTCLDGLDEVGRSEERSVCASVEPRDAASQNLYAQLAAREIGTIDVCDFEL